MNRSRGLLALSPLLVFLAVYLVSSFMAKDFYKVPVVAAFLLASAYAILITRGGLEERVAVFSRGAGNGNVLLMIWIFVLAGVFAATAKAIGSIDAVVAATLHILPGRFILVGLFVAACFISMAIGTSVGTIVALVPIASGLASGTGAPLAMVVAAIVGGAFFGDNLSFISDTTIAATRSQECSMADKFRANIWIAGPAAIVVAVVYVVLGQGFDATAPAQEFNLLLILPYLAVIILALCGLNVLGVLSVGIFLNAVIGLLSGKFGWLGFLQSAGVGVASMGDLIIVTMLAGGMLEIIRVNGGIDWIINPRNRRAFRRGPQEVGQHPGHFLLHSAGHPALWRPAADGLRPCRHQRGVHHRLPVLSAGASRLCPSRHLAALPAHLAYPVLAQYLHERLADAFSPDVIAEVGRMDAVDRGFLIGGRGI